MFRFYVLCVSICVFPILLANCGSEVSGGEIAILDNNDTCPPEAEDRPHVSDGIDSVAAAKYTFWRPAYPPRACAGALAGMIPELPEGFGLRPVALTKPPIMNDTHIAFSIGRIPQEARTETLSSDVPLGTPIIDFEIIRYSPNQRALFEQFLANRSREYFSKQVSGQTVYLVSGPALMRIGAGDRVPNGVVLPLKNGYMFKMTYSDMLTDWQEARSLPRGSTAIGLLKEVIKHAKREGLL